MITLAIFVAILVLLLGAGLSWHFDSRAPLGAAALIACACVAAAIMFRVPPPLRTGDAVSIDDSCDASVMTPYVTAAVRAALAPGVNGDAAVVLNWFADNARTSRRTVLDLTDPPPSSVRGDAVAYANWKAPRTQMAVAAMHALKTAPCRRVGTSIIGAAEAANDELTRAGALGQRHIVLATNLVEFSSALKIEASSFGPEDVAGAVRAIAQLPMELRPALGPNTSVTVLFTPVVRVNGHFIPLAEGTAIALETWATRIFRQVLHAGHVQVVIVAGNI